MKEPRHRVVCCKVTPKMAADLAAVAEADGTTVSNWVYQLLRRELYGRLGTAREVTTPVVRFSRGAPLSTHERSQVWHRSEGKCHYCKCTLDPFKFHVDHMLPVARGGTRDQSNLVAACKPCNMAKKTKTAEEFIASRAA